MRLKVPPRRSCSPYPCSECSEWCFCLLPPPGVPIHSMHQRESARARVRACACVEIEHTRISIHTHTLSPSLSPTITHEHRCTNTRRRSRCSGMWHNVCTARSNRSEQTAFQPGVCQQAFDPTHALTLLLLASGPRLFGLSLLYHLPAHQRANTSTPPLNH